MWFILFSKSLIQQIYIEHVSGAGGWAENQEHNHEKEKQLPCLFWVYSIVGDSEKLNKILCIWYRVSNIQDEMEA